MRVGQPLEIINSDPTLHNIHALPKGNSEFNTVQPIQGMKTTHTFDKQDEMEPLNGAVHAWMNADLGELAHPYSRVRHQHDQFELKTPPPPTHNRKPRPQTLLH